MADAVIFAYSKEKSARLRKERGLGFEEIIEYIEEGKTVNIIPNPNQNKRPGQWLYEVDVEGYIYVMPFYPHGAIHDLKTVYPSRKADRKHKGKSS